MTQSGFEFGAIGKVNYKYVSYETLKIDKSLMYKDYIGMINDEEIALFLKTERYNEQNFALLSNKEYNDGDMYDFFTIKEWDGVIFKYPVILIVKGCLEII